MTCECEKQKKPYTVIGAMEMDVDDLATPVDYFIGLRTVTDPQTGVTKVDPVRVPGQKVIPTGSLQNVVALTTNNTSLVIPENQVRAGYIDVQPGQNIMRYADANHPAQFLMLGEYTEGKMLVQTTGFLTIPAGHQYIVGSTYYLGENGEPTTDSTSGIKLFRPLDEYTLNINGDF